MLKVPITVMGYRCQRCGHGWTPRAEAEPRVCPKCKSPYWNRLRRRTNGRVGLTTPHPRSARGLTPSDPSTPLRTGSAQGRLKVSGGVVTRAEASGFWTDRSLQDIVAEQGVHPVKDWDSLVGGWPEGADFDAFLEAIRESRKS